MTTFQIAFLIFELILVSGVLIYLHSITISLLRGAPYVPTKTEIIDTILAKANLKPGMKFLELGCGDGRVVCRAVEKYRVIGRGVDISRLWVLLARIRARKLGIEHKVEFLHQNILESDLAWADVIYIYMMPRFLEKNSDSLFSRCRVGSVVVSNKFDIPVLKAKQLPLSSYEDEYFLYSI